MRYLFVILLIFAAENAFGGAEAFIDSANFIAGFIRGLAVFSLGFVALVCYGFAKSYVPNEVYAAEEIFPERKI